MAVDHKKKDILHVYIALHQLFILLFSKIFSIFTFYVPLYPEMKTETKHYQIPIF